MKLVLKPVVKVEVFLVLFVRSVVFSFIEIDDTCIVFFVTATDEVCSVLFTDAGAVTFADDEEVKKADEL